jgi:hypothetical protein
MVGEDKFELLASGVKAPVIARQLKRSVGATYVRITSAGSSSIVALTDH